MKWKIEDRKQITNNLEATHTRGPTTEPQSFPQMCLLLLIATSSQSNKRANRAQSHTIARHHSHALHARCICTHARTHTHARHHHHTLCARFLAHLRRLFSRSLARTHTVNNHDHHQSAIARIWGGWGGGELVGRTPVHTPAHTSHTRMCVAPYTSTPLALP